jgi:D-alanyl-lipoteichoic acid acyltransferase DltB (MBOAT superfamily)
MELASLLAQLTFRPTDPVLLNSGFFLVFFIVFAGVYAALAHRRQARLAFVTAASLYFFYKVCGPFAGLILASGVANFGLSKVIDAAQGPTRKRWLAASVIGNLGLLSYFKYTNFFIASLAGLGLPLALLDIALPAGISFYTFENLSYAIDVYRGTFKPRETLLEYLFFLTFFPKLVMGPIVRAADFIPQIRLPVRVDAGRFGRGLTLIIGGLFKKAVIADYVQQNFVQAVFDAPLAHSGIECLFAVYGYAVVIYGDFSGYSDMAIGIAAWLGFEIPPNFRTPYRAANITDFWRRWHISLSTWLRDYLYVPLGGNRRGKLRRYVNLFLTMLFGGLWHGANWKFVLWGALHGAALALHKLAAPVLRRALGFKHAAARGAVEAAAVALTFHFVCFCWIFFKAEDMAQAAAILRQIAFHFEAGLCAPMFAAYGKVFALMALGLGMQFLSESRAAWLTETLTRAGFAGQAAALAGVIWLMVQVQGAEQVLPIYLQF